MDKKKLGRYAHKCIMKVAKDTLDYLEVIMPKDQFEIIRKRILRSSNNESRAFEEILRKYKVSYVPQINEIITYEGNE